MSKFQALTLLLCLVGGSLATNVYVGVYLGPTCTAESMVEELSVPATAACTADNFEESFNSITSGYLLDYDC